MTFGVDAIRQATLGQGEIPVISASGADNVTIGVEVFGHTMGILEEVLVVGTIGLVLMAAGVFLFNRQE